MFTRSVEMLSSDSSPNISNTCYEVIPFSLTHLLASVGAVASWPLGGCAGDSLVHLGVPDGLQVIGGESVDFIFYKWYT